MLSHRVTVNYNHRKHPRRHRDQSGLKNRPGYVIPGYTDSRLPKHTNSYSTLSVGLPPVGPAPASCQDIVGLTLATQVFLPMLQTLCKASISNTFASALGISQHIFKTPFQNTELSSQSTAESRVSIQYSHLPTHILS